MTFEWLPRCGVRIWGFPITGTFTWTDARTIGTNTKGGGVHSFQKHLNSIPVNASNSEENIKAFHRPEYFILSSTFC